MRKSSKLRASSKTSCMPQSLCCVSVGEAGKEGGEGESASRLLAYHCKMGLAFALPLGS